MAVFSQIILFVFVAATVVQLFFWLFVFSKLAFFKNQTPNTQNPKPVSVVICARNEAENLRKNLPLILKQNYTDFEVVVVNDASEDGTTQVLSELSIAFKHLKVVEIIEKTSLGKKHALAVGIESAKNDWLLLTDADCYPLSMEWISGMISGIVSKNIKLVLGYAPTETCDASFLNKFIRFETIWTATQYLGFALAGAPYMGVGRNLLYFKKLYNEAGGFTRHADLASGDDDLFVNQVITQKNFTIILLPQTFMYSKPKTRWKGYFIQKKRHLSAGKRYQWQHQAMLGAVSISHFFWFVTLVCLLVSKISTIFVSANMIARISVMWFLNGRIYQKLRERGGLFWWTPILDAAYVFFYIIFSFTIFLRTSPRKWH